MSRLDLFRDIVRGETHRRPGTRLIAGEDGMISLVAIVTVTFFLVLAILVSNVVLVVNQKIEVQNGADAVTISAGTQLARGMNCITAMNHLMGELLGFVVLHDAIGGDRLYDRSQREDQQLNDTLTAAKDVAQGLGASPIIAHDQVVKEVPVEAALLDSHIKLKQHLTTVYILRAVANALKKVPFPPVVAIGWAMDILLMVIETYILVEWIALKAFEVVAIATEVIIRPIFLLGMPLCTLMALEIKDRSEKMAVQTAKAVAEMNYVRGALYPEKPRLPLRPDPTYPPSDESKMDKSQLVRATWPWVQYHRQLIFDITGWMKFSQFRRHYRIHTEKYMRKKSYEAYRQLQAFQFTINGMTPENKGNEPWTKLYLFADPLFTVMGFAHRKAPSPMGKAAFKQPNPQGLVAYAQAMLYNANNQNPDKGPPTFQPEVGWDTLNWAPPAGSSKAYEFPHWTKKSDCPRIQVNWQIKLSQVTRLGSAKTSVPEPFRKALQRVDGSSPLARTH